MPENYDPNNFNGTHTIAITFQKWAYRNTVEYKVNGNCKGFSCIDNVVDRICDEAEEKGMKLIDSQGKVLTVEDGQDTAEDWKDFIVSVEIVRFKKK